MSRRSDAGESDACPVDLNDDAALTQFCTDCTGRYPFIHLLVHCAGAIVLDTVEEGRIEDFDRQYRVNVRAPRNASFFRCVV